MRISDWSSDVCSSDLDGSLAHEGESFASLSVLVSTCDLQISAQFGSSSDELFIDGKSLLQVKQEVESKQRRASNSSSSNRRAVMRTNVPAKSKRSDVLDLDIFPLDVRTTLAQFPELDCSLDGYADEARSEEHTSALQ